MSISEHQPGAGTVAASGPGPAERAVAALDAWFETMRGPGGYGGPVVHWWRQSLLYAGPGLDWRYEGIIDGYLTLWARTGEPRWLAKARRAGDDLVAGQLPDGHFAASAFEINPASGGTPHEAAACVGLLLLARSLREAGDPSWTGYKDVAERTLRAYYLGLLWDESLRALRDGPRGRPFVPNKASTACEALMLLAELTGEAELVERYALPTLELVLAHQVRGGPLDGAIAQNSFGARRVEKYFPIYIARCVPALVRAHTYTGARRFADAALRAMAFIMRQARPDGTLPTVVYAGGQVSPWPAWVAPLGDVLLAGHRLRPLGFEGELGAVEARLLAGQSTAGGIGTAEGFAAQSGGRPGAIPDPRDLLAVVGWCDKAFRYLALRCSGAAIPAVTSQRYEAECALGRQLCRLVETPERLELTARGRTLYRWRKGEPWAFAAPALWLL